MELRDVVADLNSKSRLFSIDRLVIGAHPSSTPLSSSSPSSSSSLLSAAGTSSNRSAISAGTRHVRSTKRKAGKGQITGVLYIGFQSYRIQYRLVLFVVLQCAYYTAQTTCQFRCWCCHPTTVQFCQGCEDSHRFSFRLWYGDWNPITTPALPFDSKILISQTADRRPVKTISPFWA